MDLILIIKERSMKQHTCNKQINNTQKQKKQDGIALVDTLIAMGVVAAIIIGVYAMGKSLKSGTLQDRIIHETKVLFNASTIDCLKLNQDLSTCTTTRMTSGAGGIKTTTTPCGDTWSSTQSASSVVVTYPLDRCDDPDTFGTELSASLDDIYKINATYDAGTDDLTITYSR
jgi:hypothetical protein